MKNLLKASLLIGVGVAVIGYIVNKKNEEIKEERVEELKEEVAKIAKKVAKITVVGAGVVLATKVFETKIHNMILNNKINELEERMDMLGQAISESTILNSVFTCAIGKETKVISDNEFKDFVTTLLKLPNIPTETKESICNIVMEVK